MGSESPAGLSWGTLGMAREWSGVPFFSSRVWMAAVLADRLRRLPAVGGDRHCSRDCNGGGAASLHSAGPAGLREDGRRPPAA